MTRRVLPWLINWTITAGLMLAVMHLTNAETQYTPCHWFKIDGCAHVTIWEDDYVFIQQKIENRQETPKGSARHTEANN